MEYRKIGFIGLGLIGGSIAEAIREKYPDTELIAHARHIETLQEAYNAGVIRNQDFLTPEDFGSCDVIFLCSPVRANSEALKKLLPWISAKTLLTDVGSVKNDIHATVRALGLSGQFIGGHPMAGSEKTGFSNASPTLLENAYYILTRTEEIPADVFSHFSGFIGSLGAVPVSLTPEEHDFATAAVSHLPHIISASLVNLVRDSDGERGLLRAIAAGGFRDITRISSSSPVMWQNICLANRDKILRLLDLYSGELSKFREAVASSDGEKLLSLFSKAKEYRDSLPKKDTGLLEKTYEFSVDVEDRPGTIAEISAILSHQSISIKNIGIVHNREQGEGALRIEFYDLAAKKKAVEILLHHNYILHGTE